MNGVIITPNDKGQIVVPEEAVVIPGTRNLKSNFEGIELSKSVPIIIKYGSKVVLEDLLRP